MSAGSQYQGPWPNGAKAAIALTIDNMGEAADLDRGLWPEDQPIGNHFSVKEVLPQFLSILKKYDIKATYFVESWNLTVYPDAIAKQIAAAGHEIGWHAWRHEAWSKLKDADVEHANIARSFGPEGLAGFLAEGAPGEGITDIYKGFRPPGGIVHGERSLKLFREYALKYLSPAGNDAAIVSIDEGKDSIIVLPFRWSTVDAYYYMETFGKLRQIKGDLPEEPQTEEVLKKHYIAQIDRAIAEGGYLSFLFHPFLNNKPERLQVFEDVVKYLAEKRDSNDIWLARCCDVTDWISSNPGIVGTDPALDETTWR
ncbi:Putative NodB domain, glycoside hydrolase/deacetylase, beta/alpha-barrel [Septoria linicola]|uniref:chitin deacetylase n=1 Tax=Septoria linicola TaxID=215465 RepID=A0A9Q9B2H2_9PEZI|nr:putative NodB domain, glycoside hydrolase/deacetylase, beta/alpha-barrel [Septoria linicola]USW56353.1 Putative NodB domain, glycoside hydrolase/deacetylase, beta/alpha-barrel [Septoria linicola]